MARVAEDIPERWFFRVSSTLFLLWRIKTFQRVYVCSAVSISMGGAFSLLIFTLFSETFIRNGPRVGGNYKLCIEDVRDEIWDIVKPVDPLKITLACKQGGTVASKLIDTKGFWAHDNWDEEEQPPPPLPEEEHHRSDQWPVRKDRWLAEEAREFARRVHSERRK